MDKALNLLGICRKAGKLAVGWLPVEQMCRRGSAKLVVLACDAADNTARRAYHVARTVYALPYNKQELGRALGRRECAVAAIEDAGLADAFVKALDTTKGASKL